MRWLLACLFAVAVTPGVARAIDCSQTSIGRTPLDDLGPGLYLGQFEGGLYPNGSNALPIGPWRTEGLARAAAIQPLDTSGRPHPNGAILLECMGMSNAAQEFGSETSGLLKFARRARLDPDTNPHVRLINGCRSSAVTSAWSDPDSEGWRHFRTAPGTQVPGFTGSIEQVQAVWFKVGVAHPARQYPSLPSASAHAYAHARQIAVALRVVAAELPNVRIVFLSSRTYGGYSDPTQTLSPEPYPYESGFAVKWLVESQIREIATGEVDPLGLGVGSLDYRTGSVPFIAWGPYLWADGAVPRSDGLTWDCGPNDGMGNYGDFEQDGVHPSRWGEQKVSDLLLAFFQSSPLTRPWFSVPEPDGLLLQGAACAALVGLARRRQSQASRTPDSATQPHASQSPHRA